LLQLILIYGWQAECTQIIQSVESILFTHKTLL